MGFEVTLFKEIKERIIIITFLFELLLDNYNKPYNKKTGNLIIIHILKVLCKEATLSKLLRFLVYL